MEQKRTALLNGLIVTKNEVLQDHAIVIKDKFIEEIVPVSQYSSHTKKDTSLDIIDCSGQYILPGLIDIHSDMLETVIVPRKGLVFDLDLALYEADRQLISQGITTIFHSISIANSTICNRKRTLSVSQMVAIGDAICEICPELLIHHRFHARLEMNTIEAYNAILQRVKQGKIHELSLMNHTPGQGQYASLDMFKVEIKKQYGDISDVKIEEIIKACQEKPLLSEMQINQLLHTAIANKIPVAFHDLETNEQLSFMQRYGIRIGEFPLNAEIAANSSNLKILNLVGAPNILKMKSHNNNASAIELLQHKWAQIICSDYYSPALLTAVFMLPKVTTLTLPEAVSYATYYPAMAVCIDNQYGSLIPGKKADIIVVNYDGTIPKVVQTYVDGVKRHQLYYGGKRGERRYKAGKITPDAI